MYVGYRYDFFSTGISFRYFIVIILIFIIALLILSYEFKNNLNSAFYMLKLVIIGENYVTLR